MSLSNLYLLLADAVLFSHILVVIFVVIGLVLIFVGFAAGWQWVRNPWFRIAHLVCIAVVVAQAWAGVVCPLTTLEMWLRKQGGGEVYSGSFITHWMQALLYYDAPAWVFTAAYTGFGALVLASWFLVRPRFRDRR